MSSSGFPWTPPSPHFSNNGSFSKSFQIQHPVLPSWYPRLSSGTPIFLPALTKEESSCSSECSVEVRVKSVTDTQIEWLYHPHSFAVLPSVFVPKQFCGAGPSRVSSLVHLSLQYRSSLDLEHSLCRTHPPIPCSIGAPWAHPSSLIQTHPPPPPNFIYPGPVLQDLKYGKKGNYSSLDEIVPHRLVYLNTQSPGGVTVWGGLGGVTVLKELCHWEWA